MVEWDSDAVATVNHNKLLGVDHVSDWPLRGGDVRQVDWRPVRGGIDLVAGGPPCQPFAIGGKQGGPNDSRDMWPEAVRAVNELQPRLFIFENVRNLAGPKFRPYLEWVVQCFSRPGEKRKKNEDHWTHLNRLRRSNAPEVYKVSFQVVCAADYGAPQIRHRVLIFGISATTPDYQPFSSPTHSRERLLWDQYVTGDYWKRHNLQQPNLPLNTADRTKVMKLRELLVPPSGLPWVTVRDALCGLGWPNGIGNHVLQPGARTYPGHVGSPLDLPAKALKAGDHGVPGGENMAILDDGGVRYFTTREAARLVGLPDNYLFPRSWTESMRQLGNAVPVSLGEAVGLWAARNLAKENSKQHAA